MVTEIILTLIALILYAGPIALTYWLIKRECRKENDDDGTI